MNPRDIRLRHVLQRIQSQQDHPNINQWPCQGICSLINEQLHVMCEDQDWVQILTSRFHHQFLDLAESWPQHSGRHPWPVPHVGGDPVMRYQRYMDFWNPDQAYGQARRELLAWSIQTLQQGSVSLLSVLLMVQRRVEHPDPGPDVDDQLVPIMGICAMINDVCEARQPHLDLGQAKRDSYSCVDEFLTLAESWPHHSGDRSYPVPGRDGLSARYTYYRSHNKWRPDHGYCDQRRALLYWCIDQLRARRRHQSL